MMANVTTTIFLAKTLGFEKKMCDNIKASKKF